MKIVPKFSEKEMSLMGHLEELRHRVLWSVAAWVICTVGAYQMVPYLIVNTRPILGKAKLIFTAPTEAFIAYLQVAMIMGIFLSLPIIVYHVLRFILPGLTHREQGWLLGLLPVAILLFVAGASFAYFMVLPVTMNFFMSFGEPGFLEANMKIEEFLGFVVGICAVCGVVFQLPLVLFFGSLVGLVSSRFLRSQRRLAYFLAFVLAAVATPTPDAFTASIVAVPVIVLFELSIILIRIIGK